MKCKDKDITIDVLKDLIFEYSKLFSIFYKEFLLKDKEDWWKQSVDIFRIAVIEKEHDALVCWYYITEYTESEKQEIIDYINTIQFEQHR